MLTMWVQIGDAMSRVVRVVNYFGNNNEFATVEIAAVRGMRIAVATNEIVLANG
jgi:hypothetical protein